jgi:hypothetical protein
MYKSGKEIASWMHFWQALVSRGLVAVGSLDDPTHPSSFLDVLSNARVFSMVLGLCNRKGV